MHHILQSRALRASACLTLTSALLACGNGGAPDADAYDSAFEDVGACLAKAAASPCDTLTESMVRAALPGTATAQLDRSQTKGSSGFDCHYSWTSGRKTTIGQGQFQMEVDATDSVTLSNVRSLADTRNPLASFRGMHRTPDAAQKANAIKRSDAAIDEKVDDGSLEQRHEQMGKDFARSLINRIEWEPVDGLGDGAAWGGIGRFKTLDVLVGTTQFSVLADVASDEAPRRDASIAVARALLAACD